MDIRLSSYFAKSLLRLINNKHLIVVCKGYNEDYDNYTELVWADDRYLDFYDKDSYPEFRLWSI